jgi:hypothetical protein
VLRWTKRNPALTAAALLTALLAIAGPITAMVIAGQRNRLSDLVLEKDNLIQKYAADKQSDANRIAALRDALDLWEGRANPWELWPPKPDEAPRVMLLQDVAGQGDRLAASWRQSADPESRAFGHLALAIMNDELNRPAEAIANYEAARELLMQLSEKSPAATQYAAALADCYRQLSRLRAADNRSGAAQDLEHGRTMSRRLAREHNDPRLHAEWLESELDAAVLSSVEGRAENLKRVQQIQDEFSRLVPNDPAELYQLACFLSGREPILISRKADGDAQ